VCAQPLIFDFSNCFKMRQRKSRTPLDLDTLLGNRLIL